MNKLSILFCEFFKISLFTIGGGLAMIPVIEDTFVKKHKLLSPQDIMDMVSITQTLPGLIAINSAVFVGKKLCGKKGSFVATLGVIIPSMIIIMIIAACLPLGKITNVHVIKTFSCIRACVLGLFLVLAYRIGKSILKSSKDIFLALILTTLLFFKLNPAVVVLICCVLGGLYETYCRKEEKEQ